jgi:hypothetical protein
VYFDLARESLSPPGFEGIKYDTVQMLELTGDPNMDVVQFDIQKLSSLFDVILPIRRMHIAQEVKSLGE